MCEQLPCSRHQPLLGAGQGLCDQALAIKTRYGFICIILQSFYSCALQEQQASVW